MTAIPTPVNRVLDVEDPEDVSQPAPPAEIRSWSGPVVPVTEPCKVCGCQWVAKPDRFILDSHAECCFCRTWRGSVHRNATLSEFTEEERSPATSADEDEGTEGDTIEVMMSQELSVYDPSAMEEYDEDAVGVRDLLEEKGLI